jgi:hypothetical protein
MLTPSDRHWCTALAEQYGKNEVPICVAGPFHIDNRDQHRVLSRGVLVITDLIEDLRIETSGIRIRRA